MSSKETSIADAALTLAYQALLKSIKEKVRSAQLRAARAVNQELVQLYWEIGGVIIAKQREEGWGKRTVERLSRDLRSAFPYMRGFSL